MTDKPLFLTAEGHMHLEAELQQLIIVRAEVAQRLAAARDVGNAGENHEYDAARDAQSFVVGRIRELEHILNHARLIAAKSSLVAELVALGSTVTVRDEAGEEETYQIRGSMEANPAEGIISHESPLGQALLGRRIGDSVVVHSPAGAYRLQLVDLH